MVMSTRRHKSYEGSGDEVCKLKTCAADKILFLSCLVTREGPWKEFRWCWACQDSIMNK